ncbi:hypothetical protein FQZ97_726730 [compost metagenome]
MGLHQPADHAATAGAGEGAFAVAEEFGFDQAFGDGGAVHRHEGLVRTRAGLVQRAGHHFLAGAGLAQQQDGQLAGQALAGHAQRTGEAAVAAGQLFQYLGLLRGGRLGHRGGAAEAGMTRHLQGAEIELALGGLHAAHPALQQAGDELRRAFADQVAGAAPDQGFAAHLQQVAGTLVGGQHLAVQAQRQQAVPGTAEVLRAVVEGQHQVLRVAEAEHAALDIAGGQHQGGEVVLGLGHDALAGQVDHADHAALGVAQGHRGAGKGAEAVEVVFAAVDQRRTAFHHGGADGVGAADGFAPATAGAQVAQAEVLEEFGLAFDGQHVGLGVAEDDQPALALLADQVFQLRGGGIDQQAVAGQQQLQVQLLLQADLLALQAVEAVAQAAPPGGIDLLAQHALGQLTLFGQFQPSLSRLVQWIGSGFYSNVLRHLSLQRAPRHGPAVKSHALNVYTPGPRP